MYRSIVHPEWLDTLEMALQRMSVEYYATLMRTRDWLPGPARLFAAFSLPLAAVEYILLGESPYPRAQSANGYAFWDQAVTRLWSETGLSKAVNRATSLRNFVKMLLVARGDLQLDVSQAAIAALDHRQYQQTATQLFEAMLARGGLLLNASLVYRPGQVAWHAKHWLPFIQCVFQKVAAERPQVRVLAFGRIAEQLTRDCPLPVLVAEHPYNVSFIHNPAVLAQFQPLDLLSNGMISTASMANVLK